MRKLVIAVDCDDVLVPSAEWILGEYNRKYNISIDLSNFYSSDLSIWGVDDYRVAAERLRGLLASDNYARLEPFAEAVDVVSRIAQTHELHIVTGRSPSLTDTTKNMVDKYFEGCFKSMEHTGHFEGGDRSKGDVCRELGAHILIDDHTDHIDSVLGVGESGEAIVFGDYPWNRPWKLVSGAVRCADWFAVEKEIERIASQ